ncbi:MAG: polysaccharide biosynthesis/export family protein, partial [Pseudomonadota bacterium]
MRIALFPKIVGAILAAMTLAGCVTDADPTANVSAGDEQAFSEPILFTVDDYRLGAGDRVKITVFGEPDLSGEFAVDGTGYVSLPLVGEIKAAALTVREFQSAVDVAFRDGYLKDPKVSAEVTTYRPYFIL